MQVWRIAKARFDTPSMDLGTAWLEEGRQLGLTVPSSVLPFERNIMLNPEHAAANQIKILDVTDFFYDSRIFTLRT